MLELFLILLSFVDTKEMRTTVINPNCEHIVFTVLLFVTRPDSVLISCSEAIDDPALTFTPTVVEEDGGSEQVSGGTEIMSQQHVALISQDGTQQVWAVENKLCIIQSYGTKFCIDSSKQN